jgi:hypothetical protein
MGDFTTDDELMGDAPERALLNEFGVDTYYHDVDDVVLRSVRQPAVDQYIAGYHPHQEAVGGRSTTPPCTGCLLLVRRKIARRLRHQD